MHKLLPVLAAALLTSACGVIYRQPIYQGNLLDKSSVEQIQVGMDKQQVIGLLGTPAIADPFHQERWDYTATQRVGRVGKAEVKNFIVYFEGDKVVRWEGDYFPEQDEQLAQAAVRQFGPNLAKDKEKDKKRRRR
ncbi:MAG: outer membrane protein assembly factor BamE [Lysobacter sp.]|nr:MAG: outer membrane protein assembly factor BamE [Lysobacter sp.]